MECLPTECTCLRSHTTLIPQRFTETMLSESKTKGLRSLWKFVVRTRGPLCNVMPKIDGFAWFRVKPQFISKNNIFRVYMLALTFSTMTKVELLGRQMLNNNYKPFGTVWLANIINHLDTKHLNLGNNVFVRITKCGL